MRYVDGILGKLHGQREELQGRLEHSKEVLEAKLSARAENEEAMYLARIAEKFASRKTTALSLESVSQEIAFLSDKLEALDKGHARKKTHAMLLCHAVEELRNELETDVGQSMDVSSSISDISMT